jgi:fumarate hydratase subunit alpha
MRQVAAHKIQEAVSELCIEANLVLRKDILSSLQLAYKKEKNKKVKKVLAAIIENAKVAREKSLAICQDTGLACVFVELGQELRIVGDLKAAIHRGIESGYKRAYLRNSVVLDPLLRGKPGYKPAIIHIDMVRGDKIKLTVMPKGFGCENKTQLKMFNPTAGKDEIKKFIIEVVKDAGPNACPPYVVGVGIGGTADYACLLAKKALLENIGKRYTVNGKRNIVSTLEGVLLKEINQLGVGPMGLGGQTTCLGVKILTYSTHIAGLPVVVNISCHALRSATKIL